MKGLLPVLAFALITFNLTGQDIITVPTIDWENDARSGVYTFPDDETRYEKILMYYNMRCKNGDVNTTGGNDVACGEWDYSCNTYIVDSSRVDSLAATHPNYLIPGFNGDVFGYRNDPTHTYYQYNLTTSTIDNPGNTQVLDASGNMDRVIEMGEGAQQVLLQYNAGILEQLGLSSGPIYGIQIFTGADAPSLRYATIRMRHIELTGDDLVNPFNEDWQTVYRNNKQLTPNEANAFVFAEAFNWNGTSGIAIELSYHDASEAFTIVGSQVFGANFGSRTDDGFINVNGSGNLEIPAAGLSGISNEITIAGWFKGNARIMPVNNSVLYGIDADGNRQVNVHLPWSNGQVYWDCGFEGGYDRINTPLASIEYEGTWSHWAFVKNADEGTMAVYRNGDLISSGTGKDNRIDIERFIIGSDQNGGNPYFGGIDDIQIWKKALDPSAIRSIMFKRPNVDDNDLVAYYDFNEQGGDLVLDQSMAGAQAELPAAIRRSTLTGNEIRKGFENLVGKPDVAFLQGDLSLSHQSRTSRDSVQNAPVTVRSFSVNGTDLEEGPSFTAYENYDFPVYDDQGSEIDVVTLPDDDALTISTLNYYNKFPMEIELMSFVTPYGIGLDLGPDGKTWVFDVTDYAPVLRGDKRIFVRFAGARQEELDIKFEFHEGTPPADVLDIRNIWSGGRSFGINGIVDDRFFPPVTLKTRPDAARYKVRSIVTGHGQNGEFVPRQHYMDVNGGDIEFTYEVWKECAFNPVYPQGGTWIFDRSGWCPGAPTDVHEFDITDEITDGTFTLDYGLVGGVMASANYIVANQLVTYGPANFQRDAAITEVIRPSNRVEYDRFNPSCNFPTIVLQNTGAERLTGAVIEYGLEGEDERFTYEWSGDLPFMESAVIELDAVPISWFTSSGGEQTFIAEIKSINGGNDEYAQNNVFASEFDNPDLLRMDANFDIRLVSNNVPTDNNYVILDSDGNNVFARAATAANTQYIDEITLAPGCYTIRLQDVSQDGLSFWFFPSNGNGAFFIVEDDVEVFRNFNPDFGGGLEYDFIVEGPTNVEDPFAHARLSVYPNPTTDFIHVDFEGMDTDQAFVRIHDLAGRTWMESENDYLGENNRFDVSNLSPGMYMVEVRLAGKIRTFKFVKK